MATKYSVAAGAFIAVAADHRWSTTRAGTDWCDSPSGTDVGVLDTAMTLPNGAAIACASLDLYGDSNGSLTVTGGAGAATITVPVITGLEKLNDTAATNLVVTCTTANGSSTPATGFWARSATATPTTIVGAVDVGAATLAGDNGLWVATGKKLLITGSLVARSGGATKRGIFIQGTGSLVVSGDVLGTNAAVGAGIGIELDNASSVLTSSTGSAECRAGTTGSGIISVGAITAAVAITAVAYGTNPGVSLKNGAILTAPDVIGSAGDGGIGVKIGDAAGRVDVVGNVTGTLPAGAATGCGVFINWNGYLTGDILVTDNPTSAWIGTSHSSKIRLVSSGGNTIQLGDAEEFCPTANVVAAANVVAGNDNYTGGSAGTYPTTATTQNADKVAIEATVLDTDGTDSVIALPNGVNATAGTALVYAAGEAAQLIVDAAVVNGERAQITPSTPNILAQFGVAGTLNILADNPKTGCVGTGLPVGVLGGVDA